MLENSDINVIETEFDSNKSGFGGAIRYKGLIPMFLYDVSSSNLK